MYVVCMYMKRQTYGTNQFCKQKCFNVQQKELKNSTSTTQTSRALSLWAPTAAAAAAATDDCKNHMMTMKRQHHQC